MNDLTLISKATQPAFTYLKLTIETLDNGNTRTTIH